jgi:hypothetical protein
MAKLPLPERGQPLDVTYVYEMANAINQIATEASSTTKNVSVDTPVNGTQYSKVGDVKIFASYISVVNSASKTSGEEVTFSIPFNNFLFKYPPIVTATPVNVGNTVAGRNVTVVISSITASGAQGVVRFNSTGGDLSVGVNAIVIGIPN